MASTFRRLFAFVDPMDPFTIGEVAGGEQPGPILSILSARQFESLFLFYTPHTRENALATRDEVRRRHPGCEISAYELPVSDPKDYSALMGNLARQIKSLKGGSRGTGLRNDGENYVCVSSGTAEMRAAWFLLTATGFLPAKLLQLGSPTRPLFGAPNVKEVRFEMHDWAELRELMMPTEYFASPFKRAFGERAKRLAHKVRELHETAEDPLDCADLDSGVGPVAGAALPPLEPAAQASAEDHRLSPLTEPEAVGALDEALQELGIVIGSALMRDAAERAAIAAESTCPVLLLGETGTGKERFATLIHRLSSRRDQRLVAINCAAIPKELAESYLFGHVRGAFTGAAGEKKGVFEEAHETTLFLDEVSELALDIQAKLLRVLQDGVVQRVGSTATHKVDVRIIAATNRDLLREVKERRFREDLYYRLEVVHIQLPPLRQRRTEIAELSVALVQRINQRRQNPRRLSTDALKRLEAYDWPGNVRQLANVLERSVLFAPKQNDVLGPDDLLITDAPAPDPFTGLPEPAPGFSLQQFLNQVRKQLILRALAKCDNNQSDAAKLLGISKQAVSQFLSGEATNTD
ncbi:MAG: sigma 54-interacting transcriptional regulator [Acidobacteria bacterium]|nr:sigma 54-interacting transcriptional regulator [Acidobacteriota bacterium]